MVTSRECRRKNGARDADAHPGHAEELGGPAVPKPAQRRGERLSRGLAGRRGDDQAGAGRVAGSPAFFGGGKYRGKVIDLRTAAADLDVDALLTGNFVHDGDELRITAQLTNIGRRAFCGAARST